MLTILRNPADDLILMVKSRPPLAAKLAVLANGEHRTMEEGARRVGVLAGC